MDWIKCSDRMPPDNPIGHTKIADEQGTRNKFKLMRINSLRFLPDKSMHVYYNPTHWKPFAAAKRRMKMNNRYLFRGKCEITGKWFYGSLSQTQSWDYRKEKALVPCIVHETDRGLLIKEVDPATIGQCTGLSAKKSYRGESPKDLLIFEGDTVQADWYDYDECAKFDKIREYKARRMRKV